jgi:hypoxanthine phosphoribosyltransferase
MTEFNCAIEGKTGLRREPFYVADKHSMPLEHFYIPAHYQDTLDGLLIPYGAISDRIEKLAYDITQDYNGQTIHLICVLKGKFADAGPFATTLT